MFERSNETFSLKEAADPSRIALLIVIVELIVANLPYTTLLLVDCEVTATSLELFTVAVCTSVMGSTDPFRATHAHCPRHPLVTARE